MAHCASADVVSGGFYAHCALTELQGMYSSCAASLHPESCVGGPALEDKLWSSSEQLVAAALQRELSSAKAWLGKAS